MAETKAEYKVEIANEPARAAGDGVVKVEVTKFAPWFDMTWNRQRLTHGITAIPSGSLVVEVPVEGVLPGEAITPEQLAELLIFLMSTVLPTCSVFIEAVENEFGYNKVEDF